MNQMQQELSSLKANLRGDSGEEVVTAMKRANELCSGAAGKRMLHSLLGAIIDAAANSGDGTFIADYADDIQSEAAEIALRFPEKVVPSLIAEIVGSNPDRACGGMMVVSYMSTNGDLDARLPGGLFGEIKEALGRASKSGADESVKERAGDLLVELSNAAVE
jgi:hypothetical protein